MVNKSNISYLLKFSYTLYLNNQIIFIFSNIIALFPCYYHSIFTFLRKINTFPIFLSYLLIPPIFVIWVPLYIILCNLIVMIYITSKNETFYEFLFSTYFKYSFNTFLSVIILNTLIFKLFLHSKLPLNLTKSFSIELSLKFYFYTYFQTFIILLNSSKIIEK